MPPPPAATETVPASRTARVRGWFRSRSLHFRLMLWLVAIVATTLLAFWWYRATEPGTFVREGAVALLGAVVTIVPAALIAGLTIVRQLRRTREAETLTRFAGETWHRRALQVGRMRVPGIVVVASGNSHREWTDRVDVEFEDWAPARTLRADVQQVVDARAPELVTQARERQVPFTDDPAVDLVDARVSLRRDAAGVRRPVYRLTPAPMTYHPFVATAADLDRVAADDPRPLRERFGPDLQSLDQVSRLPVQAKVGVGTLVVTSDRRMVLGVRGNTMIAGKHDATDERSLVHVVAEGAVPTDLDRNGRFDPLATAGRGVLEEVGIGEAAHAISTVRKIVQTGFFLDQQRWQPCFANIAYIDLTWDELQSASPAAQDHWEVERYLSLPFDLHHPGVRLLLLGQHPDLALASNHAAAVVWFALVYEHGFTVTRDLLARPVAENLLAVR